MANRRRSIDREQMAALAAAGMSAKDIAYAMNIPASTVKLRLDEWGINICWQRPETRGSYFTDTFDTIKECERADKMMAGRVWYGALKVPDVPMLIVHKRPLPGRSYTGCSVGDVSEAMGEG